MGGNGIKFVMYFWDKGEQECGAHHEKQCPSLICIKTPIPTELQILSPKQDKYWWTEWTLTKRRPTCWGKPVLNRRSFAIVQDVSYGPLSVALVWRFTCKLSRFSLYPISIQLLWCPFQNVTSAFLSAFLITTITIELLAFSFYSVSDSIKRISLISTPALDEAPLFSPVHTEMQKLAMQAWCLPRNAISGVPRSQQTRSLKKSELLAGCFTVTEYHEEILPSIRGN